MKVIATGMVTTLSWIVPLSDKRLNLEYSQLDNEFS
jgi:hypothetical protein